MPNKPVKPSKPEPVKPVVAAKPEPALKAAPGAKVVVPPPPAPKPVVFPKHYINPKNHDVITVRDEAEEAAVLRMDPPCTLYASGVTTEVPVRDIHGPRVSQVEHGATEQSHRDLMSAPPNAEEERRHLERNG